MTQDIFILHGSDAIDDAHRLQSLLLGYNTITFQRAMELAPIGEPIIKIHTKFVTDSKAVIVIASKNLFEDNFLVGIASMAIFSHNFIPVLMSRSSQVLPSWFSVYTSVDLKSENSAQNQLKMLISTLRRLSIHAS